MAESFGIGEVSELTGIGVDALRFYEREGLLVKPVPRDSGGRRRYSSFEVEWLRMCVRLRGTGMPVSDVRRYAELVRAGEGNEAERLDLLAAHQHRVEEQLADLASARDAIAAKVDRYATHLAAGTAGELRVGNPAPRVPAVASQIQDEVA